jgi:hypothetical protein
VLDRLCTGQQAGVVGVGLLEFLHDLLALFDQAEDGLTGFSARRLFQQFEDFFEPFDLTFSLSTSRGRDLPASFP